MDTPTALLRPLLDRLLCENLGTRPQGPWPRAPLGSAPVAGHDTLPPLDGSKSARASAGGWIMQEDYASGGEEDSTL